MKYEIREFSKQAFAELINSRRRFLIGDVGSGKTALVLKAAQFREEWIAPTFPLLIISHATISKTTWQEEGGKFEDFKHLRISSLGGDELSRMEKLHRGAHVYSISFNLVPWLLTVPGALQMFKSIVIDESTRLAGLRAYWRGSKIAMAGGKQAVAIARFCLQPKQQWVVELSGTPIARGFHALYGQMFLIDGGRSLGVSNYSMFQQTYMEPKFFGSAQFVPKKGAVETAMKRIARHVSNLDVEEQYPDLPKVNERVVEFELSPAIKKQYRKLEDEAVIMWEESTNPIALTAGNISQKLLQFTSGFNYIGDLDVPIELEHKRTGKTLILKAHEEKERAFLNLVGEINRPTIVVYYHKGTKQILEKHGVKFIDSSNIKNKELWDAGRIKLLGLHWQTAFGLSLQYGGHDMIFFDIYWSGELWKQLIARIGPVRQHVAGFDRTTNIYYLIAKGTVDEDCLEVCRGRVETENGAIALIRRLQRGHH